MSTLFESEKQLLFQTKAMKTDKNSGIVLHVIPYFMFVSRR